ncbi:MFS transporter [Niameybacter massiliensis]|uniref:MFS transporter n=1 Tax=Niameybacter massiliensis TaxID=1658108 RepID=UPI0006B514DF|nr:MFS transporter [Niameybacter massiliensis]
MKEKIAEHKRYIAFIGFGLCMIVLGASDSLRGIFSAVFQNHFSLSTTELSLIVTVSYLGNLVFLLCGGNLLDRFNKKKVFLMTLGVWMIGALLFVTSESYPLLLVGMFLCMGTSTLMNTTINILVPVIFAASPGLIVNILFFVQGIGTSGAQNIVGRAAVDIVNWKLVNGVLLGGALVSMLILFFFNMPQVTQKEKESISYKSILKNPAFIYCILIFGFYFIAEHGILNWFLLYGINGLGIQTNQAAVLLSIFFGGITVGRLIFAPVVQKLGVERSIIIFGGIATILYGIGIVGGSSTVVVLSSAGLAFSILYPTLVLMLQNYYEKECIASATGMIISIATLFDIGFNLVFGKVVDLIGMRLAFFILLGSMIMFFICLMLFWKRAKQYKQIEPEQAMKI